MDEAIKEFAHSLKGAAIAAWSSEPEGTVAEAFYEDVRKAADALLTALGADD